MNFLEPSNGGAVRFNASQGPVGHASIMDHLGPEASVAYNPYAPPDEVEDASSRLARIYAPHASDINTDLFTMSQQYAMLQKSERNAQDILAKAMRLRDGSLKPDRQGKAETSSWGSEFGRGYFRWFLKTGVQLPILRAFGRRIEAHQAILRTRLRQIDRFARPSRNIDQLGWRLVMKDEEGEATEEIKKLIKWMTEVIECGGREFDPVERRRLKRQNIKQFLRYLVHDGLELDNSAVELISLEGAQGLDSWYVRPSETFAIANPQYAEKMEDGREIYCYQVLNGRAEIPFAYDELALFVRNASTWAEENGYGYSEFEQTLETLNNIIQSITYTRMGIGDSAVPRGILMAYGNYDHQTQEKFKQAWQAKVRGVQNQFGLPILFSRGQQGAVQYLQTGQPFDEMAFSKWIAFNFTIAGAIYGVSPEEIGMEGFTAEKSSLSGDDTTEKLASSKDKGLYPLLKDCGWFVSEEIIRRFTDKVRFEFTGLDLVNTEERWQEKIKHMTINEVRAMFDLEPHPLGWFGDLPADAGEQSAEFQRMQQTLTFGESRKIWGSLPEYPSPMVNETPLNPSLGAVFMQALMSPGTEEDQNQNAEEGQDGAGQEDQGNGEGENGPKHDLLGTIHSRMATLAQKSPTDTWNQDEKEKMPAMNEPGLPREDKD
jgi:hypothetical protein